MQNKGFVKLIAVVLTIVCCLYLSFTVVANHYDSKIEEIAAQQGQDAADRYQDSILNKEVYLGKTLKQCRELGVGLGLDLKGGMNVILEVGVPDVLKALSDHKEGTNENFRKALEEASAQPGGDYIAKFIKSYKKLAGDDKLSVIFATQQLSDVKPNSTDAQVEEVLRKEVASSIENSYNVLRNRIDQFGVAQPNIQRLEGEEGRIMIELPGIKEPERVRKLLQGSANLEFWECYIASEIMPFISRADAALAQNGDNSAKAEEKPAKTEEVAANDTTETAEVAETDSSAVAQEEAQPDSSKSDIAAALSKTAANDSTAATPAAAAADAKNHPLLSLFAQPQHPESIGGVSACVVGYVQKYNMERVMQLLESPAAKAILPQDVSFKWGVKGAGKDEDANLYELCAIKVTQANGRAPLEGNVVDKATETYENNKPAVSMSMNAEGARTWANLTKKNVNRPIAIVLDDRVYSAPNVINEITGGQSQITGSFTPEDTRDLVNVLNSGRMPAPAHIVSEEIVGPSLGAESINQGMWSCVIAFVILMIYMIAMYGFTAGMVANIALVLNLFFTVGVLSSFQAALTMSGIAGMVLSLGMAVDANVLIYERAKEELRAGKRTQEALSAGYKNAFSAIFDSNLTSIITAVILFNFGTGPIRGFATTLMIGICVSFFTAVFLTRIVYEGMMKREKWLNLNFTTPLASIFFKNPSYKFMNAWKKSFIVFGVLAVISIGFMAVRGFSKSIDFTGGRNFVVMFDKEVQPEDVRTILDTAFPESNTSAIALGTEGKTIRITTNYRINEEGNEVDSEIEDVLYQKFHEAGMLTCDKSTFINRDDRSGGSIISSQKVGPSVADDITKGAIWSVILAFVAIFVYILIRFRNVAFSVGAISALILDIILILGMYAICWGWMPFSLEIDQTFIGAVLTAIGYSINDKVVVFDRIREFIGLYPKRDKKDLFNTSLNTTLTRTINTSVSTFIVLAVIFCLGGASIRSFAFAMILGVIFGTLSSIFIAAPTAYLTMSKKGAKKEA